MQSKQATRYNRAAAGETMAEQRRSGTFNNAFKFNGKELDTETGLYYYGARYYNPRTSIFLSVDPLTESTMTPYQYTYQNPINMIDPTGMAAQDPPTKANRSNHGFEIGGKYVDETGTYIVDNIDEDGISWRSNRYDSNSGTIISEVTHRTEFRSRFSEWLNGVGDYLFKRDGDRGYAWQGDAPQTFFYIYSLKSGRPHNGDRGFYKEGDIIRSINFDDFLVPGNSVGRAENILEVINQTLTAWNHTSSAIDLVESMRNDVKKLQYENDSIELRIWTHGVEGDRGHFGPKTYKTTRKDSLKTILQVENYNDSINKILKNR